MGYVERERLREIEEKMRSPTYEVSSVDSIRYGEFNDGEQYCLIHTTDSRTVITSSAWDGYKPTVGDIVEVWHVPENAALRVRVNGHVFIHQPEAA